MTKDMVINLSKRCKDPSDKKFTLPKQARDLAGQRFGRLVALEPVGKDKGRNVLWLCQCDCGKTCIVRGFGLTNGHAKSCGCLQHEAARATVLSVNKTHGMCGSSEYGTWQHMIQRCENPKNPGFKDWGGRGIKVCKRWHNFENFYKDMGKRPEGRSIDRIDNDGNYLLENCRWATMKEQVNNQRDKKTQLWFLGFNTLTGVFEESNNQAEFAREHHLPKLSVWQCLHGKQKQTQGWEFDYLPFQE